MCVVIGIANCPSDIIRPHVSSSDVAKKITSPSPTTRDTTNGALSVVRMSTRAPAAAAGDSSSANILSNFARSSHSANGFIGPNIDASSMLFADGTNSAASVVFRTSPSGRGSSPAPPSTRL